MKTIRNFGLGMLAFLCLQACQKTEFEDPQTADFEAFMYDDPEIEGNDEQDNVLPPQTDFLFDSTQDTVTLQGNQEVILFDEDLVSPAENLMGLTLDLDLFEPNQPERKVASAAITIQQVMPLTRDSLVVYAPIRFDFGHGSLYAEGQFTIRPAGIESQADLEGALQEITILEGTRLLRDQAFNFRIDDIQLTIKEMAEDRMLISYQVSLGIEEEKVTDLPDEGSGDLPKGDTGRQEDEE